MIAISTKSARAGQSLRFAPHEGRATAHAFDLKRLPDDFFDDPFRFDITRRPNPHVSFGGGGPHYCLGANLAKKEVAVLLPAVLKRFDVRLTGDPVWAGAGARHNVAVSIDRMPVELTPRGGPATDRCRTGSC